MPTPAGRYTRQRIRELALNRAGNRQLERDATDFLAQHLFELYTLADWPFLYVEGPVALAGTFALPTDFLATQDDRALRVSAVDGTPQPGPVVVELEPERFDALASGGGAGYPPVAWTVARGTSAGRCFPDPAGHAVDAVLRYKRIVADPSPVDEPADVPVFPWHNYLVQAVYVFALEHERDPRALAEAQVRDGLMAMIRRGSFPVRTQRLDIPLDPLTFGTPFRGD
jgi:hypothetical protein